MLRFDGATDVTRTHDLLITNQLLYRLSYSSIVSLQNRKYITTLSHSRQQAFFCRTGGVVGLQYILDK